MDCIQIIVGRLPCSISWALRGLRQWERSVIRSFVSVVLSVQTGDLKEVVPAYRWPVCVVRCTENWSRLQRQDKMPRTSYCLCRSELGILCWEAFRCVSEGLLIGYHTYVTEWLAMVFLTCRLGFPRSSRLLSATLVLWGCCLPSFFLSCSVLHCS